MSNKAPQIDSLTPLRGIAALWVVLFHLDGMAQYLHLGTIHAGSGIVSRAYLWVDFFFVLSGFIITHVYGMRFTSGVTKRTLWDFLVARFSRLYPLHLFTLCLVILLNMTIYRHLPVLQENGLAEMADAGDLKELPYHLLWLSGIGIVGLGWNFPSWSIATEWWTYILTVPLYRFLNRGVSKRTYGVLGLCLLTIGAVAWRHTPRSLDITFDFGLVRCLAEFVMGICCYQFYRDAVGQRWLRRDRAFLLVAILALLCFHFPTPPYVGTVMMEGFPVPVPHPATLLLDLSSLLVFMGIILCAAQNRRRVQGVLNTKPMRYLGELSFSIYLMQASTFTFFYIMVGYWRESNPTGEMALGLRLGFMVTTLVLTVLCSMLTYHGVEKPARTLLRRLLMR